MKLKKREKKQSFFGKANEILNINQYDFMLFFMNIKLNILKIGFKNNKIFWVESYTKTLNNISILLSKINKFNDALELSQISKKIIVQFYNKSDEYKKIFINNLYIITSLLNSINQFEKATKNTKELLSLTEKIYFKEPNKWLEVHIYSLLNLALSTNDCSISIKIVKKSLNIIEEYYNIESNRWASLYTNNLIELSKYYEINKNNDEAKKLLEKSLNIRKVLYEEEHKKWIDSYIEILFKISVFLENTNETYKAIKHNELALKLLIPLFNEKKYKYASLILNSLINLTSCYLKLDQNNNAKKTLDKANEIIKYLKNRYYNWKELYANVLECNIYYYVKIGNITKAMELHNELNKYYKSFFEENSSRYYEIYESNLFIKSLLNFLEIENTKDQKESIFDFNNPELDKIFKIKRELDPSSIEDDFLESKKRIKKLNLKEKFKKFRENKD